MTCYNIADETLFVFFDRLYLLLELGGEGINLYNFFIDKSKIRSFFSCGFRFKHCLKAKIGNYWGFSLKILQKFQGVLIPPRGADEKICIFWEVTDFFVHLQRGRYDNR